MGPFVSWAPATRPPTVAAVPVRFDRVDVALSRGSVILSWTARQALMRRLQHVQESVHIRASFSAGDEARSVQLRPGQCRALLRALDAWALDPDGYALIPQELLDLRNALLRRLALRRVAAAPSRTLPRMPERLDRVTIQLSRGPFTITWDQREELLQRATALGHRELRQRFDAVGASRPVELTSADREVMVEVLGHWVLDEYSEPIVALRNAVLKDFYDDFERNSSSALTDGPS